MTEISTEDGIIEITVDDEYIDRRKYENILEEFRSQIEQHGKIKVIEVVEQFPDFDPTLLWDDLKELRQEQELSQSELAEELGVSAGTISNWERGKGSPSEEAVEKMQGINS
jgi:DNA-binding transcriptional regulator YiaG